MEDEAPPPPSVVAARVAAYGLPGTPAISLSIPSVTTSSRTCSGQCEHHRLLGLLGVAVRDEAVPVTAGQHDRSRSTSQAWLAHALRVERLLLEATVALDAAGLEHRVLKGVALAHLAYPDPAWRVFGDLDLLVPGALLTEAVGCWSAALGLSRVEAELRPGFDDRFGKEALLQAPGGPELDLHRTFAQGALGLTIDARRPLPSPASRSPSAGTGSRRSRPASSSSTPRTPRSWATRPPDSPPSAMWPRSS